ncbi:amidophosphoribosyltransferase [Guggenheimella bovis]
MLDKLKEECGVVGVFSKEHHDVGARIYFGLISLQHRGQEAAGIACWQINRMVQYKNLGLVKEVFDEERVRTLSGSAGIGHVRYSTTGSDERKNAQPLTAGFKGGEIALAHNGNLINAMDIRSQMIDEGNTFETTIDTEVILRLIAKNYHGNNLEAIEKAVLQVKGAYALVILINGTLYGVRDPYGLRPLVLGEMENGDYVLASETTALDLLGATFLRDIEKGEIVEISEQGIVSKHFDTTKKKAVCSFEYVYFARPDSVMDDVSVFEARKKMGQKLAEMDEERYDIVAPVPDSGIAAAIGYSHASGIPYTNVLIKNKYIGRTFIDPTQEQRELSLKLKLNVLKSGLEGKRVVLVDDSIVRGTTMKNLIYMLKKGGAKEVHVRISSPPVMHSCYFGIDTPSKKNLMGANYSIEEIRERIGADSLKYLTVEDLKESIGCPEDLCLACFNGDYPMEVPTIHTKYVFETN